MKKKKIILISLSTIVSFCLILFGLTFIPRNMININAEDVSKISVFNGSTGKGIEITDDADIEHIINNLGDITFQKGNLDVTMGYKYNVTIHNKNGKEIKVFRVKSNNKIIYNEFSYEATKDKIDLEYIEELFHTKD